MTLYIGVDYHPYRQTVARCESEEGEIEYREFLHCDRQSLKAYYAKAGSGAVVGVEATGSLEWFERMLFDKGIELQIGDPRLIRRAALSRHKNDFRDAETILDLLMSGRFPRIEPRSRESREVLQMLNYRQTLIRQRTSIANQMQAFARSKGLKKFATRTKAAKETLIGAAEGEVEMLLAESRFSLYEELTVKIKVVEDRLEKEAAKEERVKLLQTHSGVGKLTALAVVHALGDARRFPTRDKVAAFAGLDPLDHSSGERRRIGRISKHGSRLLRHLLGQAALASKDTRLRQFYSRVSRRRGHAVAKVATARKLLINCYVMLRDNITYQEFRRRGEVGLCESALEPETVSDTLIARPAIFE